MWYFFQHGERQHDMAAKAITEVSKVLTFSTLAEIQKLVWKKYSSKKKKYKFCLVLKYKK